VTSVQDDATKLVGVTSTAPGASPHNLLGDTLGDELKLATGGKARVFAISLKRRAAVLPAGFSGDGALIGLMPSPVSGSLPPTIGQSFLSGRGSSMAAIAADKYWNREWKRRRRRTFWDQPLPARVKTEVQQAFIEVIVFYSLCE